MDQDDLIKSQECRERAAHCLSLANEVTDGRVRELLHKMGRMWSKLATETERRWLLRRDVVDQGQAAKATRNDTARSRNGASANGVQSTISSEKPKSRLLAYAPQCPRCKKSIKVRTVLPGRKVDDVAYGCEDCGE
jgi:hypothetical protein